MSGLAVGSSGPDFPAGTGPANCHRPRSGPAAAATTDSGLPAPADGRAPLDGPATVARDADPGRRRGARWVGRRRPSTAGAA
ncbi:hypothetical protein EF879_21335 [Micromonospora sp. HM5-17]|nr:hypothetical protein EF879_21335 [Micromonospora sp. HM5-17]